MECHWKFRGGRGSQKTKFLKKSMELNWNFQRGGGIQTKKPSMGGVWIFSGTTQCLCNFVTFSQNSQRKTLRESVAISNKK